MSTLPEVLSAEIQRCRAVADDCAALGSTGAFAAALLQQALRDAERALQGHDVIVIQQSLARLREVREVLPQRASAKPAVAPVGRTQWATPQPQWQARVQSPPREQFFTWGRRAA